MAQWESLWALAKWSQWDLLHPKINPCVLQDFLRAKSWRGICWEDLALNKEILGCDSAVEELKFGMSSCIHVVPTFRFIPVDTEELDLPAYSHSRATGERMTKLSLKMPHLAPPRGRIRPQK